MHDARSTRACAMRDASTIKHDGLVAWCQPLEFAPLRHSYAHKLDTVVERKISSVLAIARCQAADDLCFYFLCRWFCNLDPLPFAVRITGI